MRFLFEKEAFRPGKEIEELRGGIRNLVTPLTALRRKGYRLAERRELGCATAEGSGQIGWRSRFPSLRIETGSDRMTQSSSDQRSSLMADDKHSPTIRDLIGDVAPKLAELTDDVLFGDVWERPGLSKRDRSLITVATLVALNRTAQLPFHLARALENGVTKEELVELITHLAFYSGWPTAMSAITLAKGVFEEHR